MCRILERETNSVSSPGHLPIGTTALLMGASMLALSGCAVGPNFEKPAPPAVSGYTQQPLGTTNSANTPGGDAQRFRSLCSQCQGMVGNPLEPDIGALHFAKQREAVICRPQRHAVPLEQAQIQAQFELMDQAADGRLCHMHEPRGGGDATRDHDRAECFDLTRIDLDRTARRCACSHKVSASFENSN